MFVLCDRLSSKFSFLNWVFQILQSRSGVLGRERGHLEQGLSTVGVGGKTKATFTLSVPFLGHIISVIPSGRSCVSNSPVKEKKRNCH